jgi:hypothetical protein
MDSVDAGAEKSQETKQSNTSNLFEDENKIFLIN